MHGVPNMSLWKKVLDNFKLGDTLAQEEQVKQAINKAKKEIETAKTKKPRKPKVTKSPKEIATEKGEPYISVLNVDIDKKNLSNGSFELDWNDTFIKDLRAAGYPGKTDEDVVDMWFRNICRNVLAETFEQEVAQKNTPDNVRYINRRPGEDGRTEVS
jgi:hypothetical protein